MAAESRKRIAFFGPLSPAHSGIADYDEELLPLLQRHYEVDVYVGEKNPPLRPSVFSHIHFYLNHRRNPYDVILYQMGNNARYHEYMYGYLFQFPGAVVFHDYCLHHSRAGMLLDKGLFEEYRTEVKINAGDELGERVSRLMKRFAAGTQMLFWFPLNKLVLYSALVAAAHTSPIAEKLQINDTPVVHIPLLHTAGATQLQTDPFPGKFVIGSFGFVTRAKRLFPVMQAVARLRYFYPNLVYLIAGEVEKHYGIDAEIAHAGITDITVKTGRVPLDQLWGLLHRADVVVNLRYPSGGEMSGIIIRALASGKPLIITRLQHYRDLPEQCVMRIRADREVHELFIKLSALIDNAELRNRIGSAAQNYVRSNHDPEKVLEQYHLLIDLALKRKETFKKPDLPLHLQDWRSIMRSYILKTSLDDRTAGLLNFLKL